MPTQTLGRSPVQVPRLGLGVMTWGEATGLARLNPAKIAYGGTDGRAEEQRAFETSLAAGVTLFDTAAMYSGGASEAQLGALAQARPAVIIASKFPGGFFFRPEHLPRELAASLRRLQRQTIDLYQHHFPQSDAAIPPLMHRLADAVEADQIRAIGVSNYSAAQMRLAHAVLAQRGLPLASTQVEYSLLHRQPEVNGVLEACRELGVTLIAYSPLAMGALTGKYSAAGQARGVRRFLPRFNHQALAAVQPVLARLREIGQRYDKTPSQVALRWLIENPLVLPIPGAKNSRQAAANAGALTFQLTAAEVEALSQATLAWRQA